MKKGQIWGSLKANMEIFRVKVPNKGEGRKDREGERERGGGLQLTFSNSWSCVRHDDLQAVVEQRQYFLSLTVLTIRNLYSSIKRLWPPLFVGRNSIWILASQTQTDWLIPGLTGKTDIDRWTETAVNSVYINSLFIRPTTLSKTLNWQM